MVLRVSPSDDTVARPKKVSCHLGRKLRAKLLVRSAKTVSKRSAKQRLQSITDIIQHPYPFLLHTFEKVPSNLDNSPCRTLMPETAVVSPAAVIVSLLLILVASPSNVAGGRRLLKGSSSSSSSSSSGGHSSSSSSSSSGGKSTSTSSSSGKSTSSSSSFGSSSSFSSGSSFSSSSSSGGGKTSTGKTTTTAMLNTRLASKPYSGISYDTTKYRVYSSTAAVAGAGVAGAGVGLVAGSLLYRTSYVNTVQYYRRQQAITTTYSDGTVENCTIISTPFPLPTSNSSGNSSSTGGTIADNATNGSPSSDTITNSTSVLGSSDSSTNTSSKATTLVIPGVSSNATNGTDSSNSTGDQRMSTFAVDSPSSSITAPEDLFTVTSTFQDFDTLNDTLFDATGNTSWVGDCALLAAGSMAVDDSNSDITYTLAGPAPASAQLLTVLVAALAAAALAVLH